jgi:PHP family Zn ribbon phosphoesterase
VSETHKAEAEPAAKSGKLIHRVCIQCNNMFTVTPDKFDAKQCPNCHKG